MDESPRWLLHNLRLEEGIKTLKKAARWQKINLNLPSGFALQEVPACKVNCKYFSRTIIFSVHCVYNLKISVEE